MPYDIDLTRAILQTFRVLDSTTEHVRTDGVALSPLAITGYDPDGTSEHVDRLVEVGVLQYTREIHSRFRSDPVTVRATEAGREWVRRACGAEESPTIERLLRAGTTGDAPSGAV